MTANRNHALLSASSAERWIACPPSARLGASFPDTGSSYAAEGTEAHALAEFYLSAPEDSTYPIENLAFFTLEMDEAARGWAEFVLEETKRHNGECVVLTEQRVDFSRWVPEGFGTSDALVISDRKLSVLDFKYGKGVPVEADGNAQMLCYALGAYEAYAMLYDVREVTMTIYQPRIGNISSKTLGTDELLSWAETVLRPAALKAYDGKGDFKVGDHCRFCRAAVRCKARADEMLAAAQTELSPETLNDDEMSTILKKLDAIVSWANQLKDYALETALSGKRWPGFKLVEGRSVRQYRDEALAAKRVIAEGFDPYEKKLLGITAMSQMLGKKRFEKLLGDCLEKPAGKPALVPVSDKRPELNETARDFADTPVVDGDAKEESNI